MTEAQKKAVEVQKEIEEACIRHGLNLTIFENGMDLWIPKTIKLSWYGDLSINRHRQKHHLHRNRPVEICPLSYLAVQREVADLWETKGNIQSEE